MFYLLSGFYLCGVFFSFLIIGFFTMLGGRDSDLWKPFVLPFFWLPYMLKTMWDFYRG